MFKLADILDMEGVSAFEGDDSHIINKVISFDNSNKDPNALMWVNEKNIEKLENLNSGAVICPTFPSSMSKSVHYIKVSTPRLFFTKVLKLFFIKEEKFVISPSACIDESVKLGLNISIGNHVVIESGCVIGDNSMIGHNTVIKANTEIGENVIIGSNNTIGGVGFGYEKDETGSFIQIPHIGNVVIEKFVEIGNNTCIDRAVLGSTILRENSKIDNLVHIAHGVEIGENSLIIANAMIAGSTIIGSNVWVAPSASILNKRKVGNNSTIGMSAVVLRDVESGDIVAGIPARSIKKR